MTSEPLRAGLQERLVTASLADQLAAVPELVHDIAAVDPVDQPHVLARHIYELTRQAFEGTASQNDRLGLLNALVGQLQQQPASVSAPVSQLRRLSPQAGVGAYTVENVRPATPLSDAALLTNAKGEPNLGSELRSEIDTADEVDLLCAFVKWHGLRVLETELGRLQRRKAPLRVITTTYMGATERAALDRLVRELGAEVRIQYDAARTRLHAKAWMFRRETRYDTAYVGSSNLSRAALLDGVEWNVRLSRIARDCCTSR